MFSKLFKKKEKGNPSAVPDRFLQRIEEAEHKKRKVAKYVDEINKRDMETNNRMKNHIEEIFHPVQQYPQYILKILLG